MAQAKKHEKAHTMHDEAFYNRVSSDRLESRQVDELIGIARGLIADGELSQAEVEFLEKWLAANLSITHQPLIRSLYKRGHQILGDGILRQKQKEGAFKTLQ